MTDVHSKEIRSYNMSRIKGKDTKPELLVRRFLFSKGFRYTLHDQKLPGKPDIVLPKYKTVIFINGCFWHGHEGCKHYAIPQTRTEWWANKIETNKRNDKIFKEAIRLKGWKAITVWQCELKSKTKTVTLSSLLHFLIK